MRARDIKPDHWYVTKAGIGECRSVGYKLGETVVELNIYTQHAGKLVLIGVKKYLLPREVVRLAQRTDGIDEVRLKKAPVGTQFSSDLFRGTVEVVGKCDKNTGRWHCITHDKGFRNQLEKDLHIGGDVGGTQTHLLAWVCTVHGVETP